MSGRTVNLPGDLQVDAGPCRAALHAQRINVCHLASGDLWAGAEVQLMMLVSALRDMPEFEVSVVLLNEGELASELRHRGIPTTVIPESKRTAISIVRRLVGHFARHGIEILHTHNFKDNILGILSTLGRRGCRRVRTVHGRGEPFTGLAAARKRLYRGVDHLFKRWLVDRILAVSLDLRSGLARSCGARRVLCVHNGLDLDRVRVTRPAAELRRDLNLGAQDIIIGTMGRLVPVKGLETFLRAARLIRNRKEHVKFLIVGDGPLKETLQTLARHLGLESEVLFLGHRNDGYDVLAMMDVLVLSSLSEGIPMVLLEALALARPVVATRVGGIPEVIEDGISGRLVEPSREQELADACVALMGDQRVAGCLALAGQRRVREQFSVRSMAEKVAGVYRGLIETPRR